LECLRLAKICRLEAVIAALKGRSTVKVAEEEGFVRPQASDCRYVADSPICTICKNRAEKQVLAALTHKLATAIDGCGTTVGHSGIRIEDPHVDRVASLGPPGWNDKDVQ
jgi:hypothetical protein